LVGTSHSARGLLISLWRLIPLVGASHSARGLLFGLVHRLKRDIVVWLAGHDALFAAAVGALKLTCAGFGLTSSVLHQHYKVTVYLETSSKTDLCRIWIDVFSITPAL